MLDIVQLDLMIFLLVAQILRVLFTYPKNLQKNEED